MKLRYQLLCVLLAYSLPAPVAQAQFSQQGPKLVGTGAIKAGAGVSQGWSASISDDGNTAIIGGSGDENLAGAAWVFTRSGGKWSQQAKLVGTGAKGARAQQGSSVSLSGDGNTAIIGGLGDNNLAGAAWVFMRSGGIWSQQTKLVGTGAKGARAQQGSSVSLSDDGNTAIVGGFADDGGVNGGVGAAWVYKLSDGVWKQQAKLVGTGAIGNSGQGWSVSLSDDGNTAIVGGFADDGGVNGGVGAAWVYKLSDGVWKQQAKLIGAGAIGNSGQGRSVSLSGDGKSAILGGFADNNSAGAAWVFKLSDGVWKQQAKLVGTDAIGKARQGISVSLSDDGDTAIVGGFADNREAGATWVFTRRGEVWKKGPKLVGTGAIGGFAGQGTSVSLSGDGKTAIVGGPFDNGNLGAAWVYAKPVFAGRPGRAR